MFRSIMIVLALGALAGCGGASSALTGTPSEVHRGEADAINPARNVYVICQDRNGATITTNITNNCDKNNPITNAVEEDEG